MNPLTPLKLSVSQHFRFGKTCWHCILGEKILYAQGAPRTGGNPNKREAGT